MNTLALLSLLTASPATLDELVGLTSHTTLDDWRQRADPARRAFLERWLAVPEDDREARTQMLADFALTLNDEDALTTLYDIIIGYEARLVVEPDAPQLFSTEKLRVIRKHAALFLQHTPESEVAWRLLVVAAPDDDERLFVLSRCIERAPKVDYCRRAIENLKARRSALRCMHGHLRERLRWVHNGQTLAPDAVVEFVFNPDEPSDVLVKLAPEVPPMDDELQVFDGETLLGSARRPNHREQPIALRTVGTTLEETKRLFCAAPDRPVE